MRLCYKDEADALTIHKSQGSEYPAVMVPLHSLRYMLLQRNVPYTGIAHSKKLVVLVGQRKEHESRAVFPVLREHGIPPATLPLSSVKSSHFFHRPHFTTAKPIHFPPSPLLLLPYPVRKVLASPKTAVNLVNLRTGSHLSEIEDLTQAYGRELFARLDSQRTLVFSPGWWTNGSWNGPWATRRSRSSCSASSMSCQLLSPARGHRPPSA